MTLVSVFPLAKPLTAIQLRQIFEAVPAGFPSPAQDYDDGPLDLLQKLIDDENATTAARAIGEAMIDAGIHDGDVALVDTSKEPHDGDIVFAILDGEFSMRRLARQRGTWALRAEGPSWPDVVVDELSTLTIIGVVTVSFRFHRAQPPGANEGPLNLHALLIDDEVATFAVRVAGSSMIDAGIYDGDVALIDRSKIPRDQDVVVAYVDGDFTIKRLVQQGDSWALRAENADWPDVVVDELSTLSVFGVVTVSCRFHRPRP